MFQVMRRCHRKWLGFQSRSTASVNFARKAIERQTKSRNPVTFGGLRYHSLSVGNKAACVLVDYIGSG